MNAYADNVDICYNCVVPEGIIDFLLVSVYNLIKDRNANDLIHFFNHIYNTPFFIYPLFARLSAIGVL